MLTQIPLRHSGDRVAILLSAVCLVHCLLLPLVVTLLPWLVWLVDNDAVVHRWLLIGIVPVSAVALIRGCARHGQRALLWLGVAAISMLMGAALWESVPEAWESALTFLGSVALSSTHVLNLRALRRWAPAGAVVA